MERSLSIVIRWFSESSGDAKDILKKELTTAAPLYRVSSILFGADRWQQDEKKIFAPDTSSK